MNAIEIKGLCKSYGGFKLDNIELNLPSGCIMGLIGENGAGKTTLIKLILGMEKADAGSICVLGHGADDGFHMIKDDIGAALDEVGLSDALDARRVGNIMKNIFKNWDETRYCELLERFSLPQNKVFKDFSRGMKMKLGLSVALSHNARLLVLDEATNGLDPVARDEVMDILNEFTRDEGHSVLFSSHYVSDLEKICDYIAFLHKGRLIFSGEKDRIKEKYALIRMPAGDFAAFDRTRVLGKKLTPYGAEAIVEKEAARGYEAGPVDVEQLFLFMAKESDEK